jgi:hypothetical protein
MTIKRVKFSSIRFEDCGGVMRELRGLPLAKRRRFLDLQQLCGELVQENPDCPIGLLYDHHLDFQDAIDECLNLYGLKPEWCSAAQVMQLFFAYDGAEGLCWQLEFAEQKEVKGRMLNPNSDPYHAAIAAIWSYTPDASLADVINSIEEIPWVEVEGILSERGRIEEEANPELKRKRQRKDDFDNLAEVFNQKVETGGFTSGFSAGLAAMGQHGG